MAEENVWVPRAGHRAGARVLPETLDFSVVKRDGPWIEIDADGLNGRKPQGAQTGGPVVTF
jgi:hypothetical protein